MERIGVIGLGYVGLPLFAELANKSEAVMGVDIEPRRIDEIKSGIDSTGEVSSEKLLNVSVRCTTNFEDLRNCTAYIITVPTPVTDSKVPDFRPLIAASKAVGALLAKGDLVVYESTVYPGATENICGRVLVESSGLKRSDFSLGYSPERINPGDKEKTISKITKIISGDSPESLERLKRIYGPIITAGLHEASSIEVAEAAKVIENTQRDINIAFVNELAKICHRLNISTREVLDAAGTKWNFMKFNPGLVGGHCIGVDPYYLAHRAVELGLNPEMILSGRRTNDSMPQFIAAEIVKKLILLKNSEKKLRLGILGLTFKENVPDLRNSLIPSLVEELERFGIQILVNDHVGNKEMISKIYGERACSLDNFKKLDGLLLAVPHERYLSEDLNFVDMLNPNGHFFDLKAVFYLNRTHFGNYWSL